MLTLFNNPTLRASQGFTLFPHNYTIVIYLKVNTFVKILLKIYLSKLNDAVILLFIEFLNNC